MNELGVLIRTFVCRYEMGCCRLLLAGSTFKYDMAVLSKSNAIQHNGFAHIKKQCCGTRFLFTLM